MTATDNFPHKSLILASASPRRLQLLQQIQIAPSDVIPADIDETPLPQEMPRQYALRMACEKVAKISDTHAGQFILAADTVVACGRRILPKAETEAQARACLKMLSGRRHHVYGGVCIVTDQGKEVSRLCDTVVKFKRLSDAEIEEYIQSGEWQGKAGGYAIQGVAASYISFMQGSYSNVVGLSLYDTMQMLRGHNFFSA